MKKSDVKLTTGKRKTSVARVKISSGSGKITVNGRDHEEYFKRKSVISDLLKPFEVTDKLGKYDVFVNVSGGGLSGQAGAVRYAIAKLLREEDEKLKPVLRKFGYLTRDSRIVERKLYGHKKARRSFQFSKR